MPVLSQAGAYLGIASAIHGAEVDRAAEPGSALIVAFGSVSSVLWYELYRDPQKASIRDLFTV